MQLSRDDGLFCVDLLQFEVLVDIIGYNKVENTMSRGTAIYSEKGQKWLTRRHRQKDLALELLAKLMQGLFLSSTRENKGLSAC